MYRKIRGYVNLLRRGCSLWSRRLGRFVLHDGESPQLMYLVLKPASTRLVLGMRALFLRVKSCGISSFESTDSGETTSVYLVNEDW